jgi:iron complex outermembrane receptor protein
MFPILHRGGDRAGCLALALVLSVGAVDPVLAADGPTVETITVTARKREENLQDVPLSISALSGEKLQQLGLGSDYDVAKFAGFGTVQQTGRDYDRPVIRGQPAPAVGGEPNASYFVDGVYVTTTISTATLDVIDHVEVLKGPQSAQLGRGTFSGAINYITKKPSNELQGGLTARVGSHDDYKAGAWASGPIIEDKLLFLVSGSFESYGGQWRNTLQPGEARFEPYSLTGSPLGTLVSVVDSRYNDGIFGNAPNGGDNSRIGNEQTTDFLGKLLFRPTDKTDITFKYGYTSGNDGPFPSLPTKTTNCYSPGVIPQTGIPAGSPAWYYTQLDSTSQVAGMYCGQLSTQGLENKINIPDFVYGVPANEAVPDPAHPGRFLPGASVPGGFSAPAKPGTRRTTQRFLIDVKQGIGDFDVVARASYDIDQKYFVFDLDHTADRILGGLFEMYDQAHTTDQAYEIRVSSPGDRPVRGMLGGYYFHVTGHEEQRAFPGPGVPINIAAGTPENASAALGDPLKTQTTNQAVFGSVDWDFADRWTLSLEARYGSDEKEVSPAIDITPEMTAAGVIPPPYTVKTVSFTPRITLRWRPTDDVMVYANVAEGNKPAGFNDGYLRSNNDLTKTLNKNDPKSVWNRPRAPDCDQPVIIVCEEKAWTYEAGVKTSWLDRRATVNATVYYIDWRDIAVYGIDGAPGASGTTNYFSTGVNEGTARSVGLELESNYAVNDFLTLRAVYNYNRSKFDNARDAEVCRITANGVVFYTDANHDAVSATPTPFYSCVNNNVNGNWLPNSPEHTIILGGRLTRPLAHDREAFLQFDDSFTSRRYSQAGNFNWAGNLNLVNLSAGMMSGPWTVTGYVKNLLNDITQQANLNFVDFANPFPRDAAGNAVQKLPSGITTYSPATFYALNPTRGRDVGLTLQYRF